MNSKKAKVLMKSTQAINGWFSFEAAMLFAWTDEIQKMNRIVGDIFEIGVHHGKSAVLLGAMIQPKYEALSVCDIFGNQLKNVSRSGLGDREIFEKNMLLFLGKDLNIRIFAKSSQDLSVNEIGTNYRFFHIDGGHNPDEALNDLQLAAMSIIEEGVIIIDDPLRPEWPGVSEAIFRFLSKNEQFCSIVVGFNKMILVRREFAELYIREIDRLDQHTDFNILYPWHMKVLPFMGYPIRIFYIPSTRSENSIRTKLIKFYQAHNLSRFSLFHSLVQFVKSILH